MPTSLTEMLARARAEVPAISPQDAVALIAGGNAVVLDVRDAPELQSGGKVKDAIHISRGMLEFRADPQSPSHHQALAPGKTVLVYCASGGRSALAGKTLKDLGYADVRNLGGFQDWVAAGGAVERA